MEALAYVVAAPVSVLAVYVLVRVGSAAFFKSKQQFDKQPKGR